MKIRFQADNDLNQHIVRATRQLEPAIDFQTTHAANLAGLPDEAVLALAASQGRILVTHDKKTMPQHFEHFIQRESSTGLIIVSRNLSVASVANELLLIWAASEAEEWTNMLQWLPI
jgi:predicted nuclease of predicted toxin-antitoxin system